jgi:hypothetical protein
MSNTSVLRHSTPLWMTALALAAACTRESRNGSETAPPVAPPPDPVVPASPPAPAPSPATTPAAPPADAGDARCADIRARFNAELAKRTDRCSAAADCACYGAEGGGCGGVTDRATADRVRPISEEFHAAKCRYQVHCAPWACEPKCQNGRCVR